MIICIYGKSGSGKSTLAKKLSKKLNNCIHIDLDVLNRDLMNTPDVIADAKTIFENIDILDGVKLSSKKILSAIMNNSELYNLWTTYMLGVCNKFLQNYISSTHFDYYILDHINTPKLSFDNSDILYIECLADFDTRLARLIQRENITTETLEFRDKNYRSYPADSTYNGENLDEIIHLIHNTKTG